MVADGVGGKGEAGGCGVAEDLAGEGFCGGAEGVAGSGDDGAGRGGVRQGENVAGARVIPEKRRGTAPDSRGMALGGCVPVAFIAGGYDMDCAGG